MKIQQKFQNLSPNNKIVLKNTLGAFIVKGGALIISLFTTPAFIRYFNDNAVLGVWYTLLSVLTWFLNFDLGIGNGIRNNLVKAFTANDRIEARKIISSGFLSVAVVTLILSVVGIGLVSLVNLNWLFNVSAEDISYRVLKQSAIFVFLSIMLRFLLTTVSSIFYALQKSAVNNFLSLCVSVLQLLFVLVFHFDNPEQALWSLSLAYLIISNIPVIVAGIIVFSTILKDCIPSLKFVDKESTKKVMKIGTIFFVCQIFYMLITNTNEFLITKIFGPEYTTEYTFYYKITSLISMIVTLALTPIWSVVTKAMAEKNFTWLSKLYKIIVIAGVGTCVLQFLLVPCMQFIMNIWLGDDSISVNYIIAIAFACFGSVFVYSSMLSTVVCGLARMKLQVICYGIGIVFKFIFIFVAARYVNNWSIVVWSNTIILLPYCIFQQIDLNRYFKKQKLLNQTQENE